jgi:hypothetical protein
MPRSLGSVYGGAVTRFLGGVTVLDVHRTIDTGPDAGCNGVAVSRDGSTLLFTDGAFEGAVCAVLGGALRRVAVLAGREGMSRSIGSVHGGSVTRFLGGSYRGVVRGALDVSVATQSRLTRPCSEHPSVCVPPLT